MIDPEAAAGPSTDYVCPRCGGALRERRDGALVVYECRIGDGYSAAELWAEHCAARNRAVRATIRSLAENAALARELAAWTRGRGNPAAGARLEEEAAAEEWHLEQARRMLEVLGDGAAEVSLEGGGDAGEP